MAASLAEDAEEQADERASLEAIFGNDVEFLPASSTYRVSQEPLAAAAMLQLAATATDSVPHMNLVPPAHKKPQTQRV
jgi:hypothetical protein